MINKTTKSTATRLGTWVWGAPLVFGILCAALFTALNLMGMAPQYIAVMTPVIFIIAGVPAIRTAHSQAIDRLSYVATDNAITLLSLGAGLLLALWAPHIPTTIAQAINTSTGAYAIALFAIFLLTYYTFGLVLLNLYAVYLRCVKMGVAKWKIILTMPFTMLYCPAYFMSEKTPARTAIDIRPSWFERFNRWIVAKPIRALVCYVLLMALSVWQSPSIDNIVFTVMLLGLFGLFLLITPAARRIHALSGWYVILSIFINIGFIILSVGQLIG